MLIVLGSSLAGAFQMILAFTALEISDNLSSSQPLKILLNIHILHILKPLRLAPIDHGLLHYLTVSVFGLPAFFLIGKKTVLCGEGFLAVLYLIDTAADIFLVGDRHIKLTHRELQLEHPCVFRSCFLCFKENYLLLSCLRRLSALLHHTGRSDDGSVFRVSSYQEIYILLLKEQVPHNSMKLLFSFEWIG